MKIVALNGQPENDSVIVWCTPIIENNKNLLINPIDQSIIEKDSFEQMVEEKLISKLAKPINIANNQIPKILLRVLKKHFFFPALQVHLLRGKKDLSDDSRYYYVTFQDKEALDERKEWACNGVLWDALSAVKSPSPNSEEILNPLLFKERIEADAELQRSKEVGRSIADIALLLSRKNPFANALRVYCRRDSETNYRRLVESLLKKDDEQLELFSNTLRILEMNEAYYSLEMEEGIAEHGLNIDKAIEIFTRIKSLKGPIIAYLSENYPFLKTYSGYTHLEELKSASAHIKFSINSPNQTLADKLGRVLELETIGKMLNGHIPATIQANPSAYQNVIRLAKPDAETIVKHVPVGKEEAQPAVAQSAKKVTPSRQGPLKILGIQLGLTNRMGKLEIETAHKVVFKLSTFRNGTNQKPRGIEYLRQDNKFLFQPVIVEVMRNISEHGNITYDLLGIEFLFSAKKKRQINSLVSSIQGSVVRESDQLVGFSNGVIKIDNVGEFEYPKEPKITDAIQFLNEFSESCLEFEIENSNLKQFRSPKEVVPTRLQAIALAFDNSKAIDFSLLRERIQPFYELSERQLVAEVERHDKFFAINDDNLIEVTEDGEKLRRFLRTNRKQFVQIEEEETV